MANNILYDKAFRSKVRNLHQESLAQLMVSSAADAEVKVFTDTKSTVYFVIPNQFDFDQLSSVQAGRFNTVGSLGTASTLSTVGSTLTTFGSVASLGCGGGN